MHDVVRPPAGDAIFLAGDGEMGALMRAQDWATTPLGPLQEWPQSLKPLVGVMLAAKQPMFLVWGPDRTLLYNDAYAKILADKHPTALGRDFFEVWYEIRTDLLPIVEEAYAGRPVHMDDIELRMERRGYPEQTHFAFSYTPLRDEAGGVGGFLCACTEITGQVLSERRRAFRLTLEERLRNLDDPEAIMSAALALIGGHLGLDRVGYTEVIDDATVRMTGCHVANGMAPLSGSFPLESFGEGRIARQRQGLTEVCDDVLLDPEQDNEVWAAIDTRAIVSVPLVRERRFVASLYVNSRNPRHWTAEEIALVEQVAARTWDAVERARSEALLRKSEARLSFLDRLGAETAALAGADAVLQTTTRLLGEHTGVSVCAYADMDEDQNGFTIRGDWAAPGSTSIVGHYSLSDFGRLAVANLEAGRPLVVHDILHELAPEEAATFQSISIAATICMPLVKEGRLTALMAVHDKVPRRWTDEELTLLREVTQRSWAHVERVGAMAELRAFNAHLEQQVVERTRERTVTWEVGPDLLGVLDSQGFFRTSNPAWLSLLGWTEEEVASQSIWEMLHPDDVERTRGGFELTQQGQPAIRFPNRYRHKDGTYRWISWVGVPVDGMVYCTGRDITVEMEQEAELAERTAERDRLWRNTQDIQVVIDGQGVFQDVNPAFTSILGWAPREVVGRTVFDFVLPEDDKLTNAALEQARQDTLPVVENRYRHKDGGFRWISWVAAPEGALIYASGRHITAEKEQAAALAQTQDALRQSQKMEAVGQLTGGLAHDFNNLLAGISGSLELIGTRLSQGRLSDVERYATAAQGAARRAAALTHRLLAFARRQTLDPKPTDVNRLIAGLEELIRRTVGPAITVEVVGASGLWPTLVDPHQLENALLNLCINARDAMPDGGRITIETANKWLDRWAARQHDIPEGQYLSVCVTDTGTGMTPDVIARAFDPFFTTKPIGEGTGLGLSMIYGFAKQSGGQVRIYSEVGQGTTMCIYLPRHLGEAPVDRDEAAAETEARSEQGETVLVVDDEPTVRMLITDVLEELGYRALEAADSVEGLKVLRSDARIDLLVSDVGLPGGMNGRQMADAARQTRPDLKVLFITGYAENAVFGHGQLGPGMHVVTKPFNLDALTARIRELIEKD